MTSSSTGFRKDSTSITPLLESIHSTLTAKHGTFLNGIRELKRLFKDMDIRPSTTGTTGFSGSGRGEGKEGRESGADGGRYLSSYELKKALVAAKVSNIFVTSTIYTHAQYTILILSYMLCTMYTVGS